MKRLGTMLAIGGVLAAGCASSSGADLPDGGSPSTTLAPWAEFDASLDVDLMIDIDEYDWPPLPVDTGRYRGVVVNGRNRAGEFVQWRVQLVPAAVMEDGESITEVWVSARHVGRDLALLTNADFAETFHTILQGGGAWRAEVWRADHAVDPDASDPYEP